MSGIRSAGVVTAAGLSSRMGAFKPLLDLAGKPLICRTVESLLLGGVDQVIVVAGRNSAAITQALLPYEQVQVVTNVHYANTAMFDSIKLGLEQLQQCDAILFLPGDVPCIRPETIQLLLQQWQQHRPDVLYPVYQEENWHPPVLHGALLPKLLQYQGEQGLKGALHTLCHGIEQLSVPDVGCTLDADYPADYEALCQYWPRRYAPDFKNCQSFYALAKTPEPVQQHCLAVAQKAVEIGEQLGKQQISLQLDLLESAALLHDVCRTKPQHAQAGADFLRQYGLEAVAELVAVHMDWPAEQPIQMNEMAILYLADKLVSGNQHVSLTQRFAEKEQKNHGQPAVLQQIRRRARVALRIQELLLEAGIVTE